MTHVFVSHNSADKPTARLVAGVLAAEGEGVWFDEWSIVAGDSLTEEISDGIERCTHFILLWSKDAAASAWVSTERAAALIRRIEDGLRFITLVLDDTPVPMLLKDRKYIDFKAAADENVAELVTAVVGRPPEAGMVRSLNRALQDLIFDTSRPGDPLPFRRCPECGSEALRRSSTHDPERDKVWFVIKCEKCDWTEASN